jgi:hypothetical protein
LDKSGPDFAVAHGVAQVPEPVSIMLLSSLLVTVTSGLRRKISRLHLLRDDSTRAT